MPVTADSWEESNKYPVGAEVEIHIVNTDPKTRTLTQNAALHKFLTMLADTLNDGGLTMKKVLKEEVDILWTQESAKEYLWRPIQKIMAGAESTADAKTTDYNKVYRTLCQHLAEKFGVECPAWPTRFGD